MRKAFDRQRRFDCQAVLEVQLNLNCRDEIVPILRALQHLYGQPKLRDNILGAVARDVNRTSSRKLGRKGMDDWQILVLAAVRLGCNLNYDKLQDLAEQHHALRHIMGVGEWSRNTHFDWRRIRDNISRVRPETIERINLLVVGEGHRLVPQAAETVRADSFVVETNIHYPTESSLIRDGLRKVLALGAALAERLGEAGWRQHRHLYKKARKLARQIERIAARKGADYHQRLKTPYRELLVLAATILDRAENLRQRLARRLAADVKLLGLDAELAAFLERALHVCQTARRRVLEGEKVPNQDKLFSIFETHTQLYKRGKTAQPVQFGRQVLVYEDAAGFVCHGYLLPRDSEDREVVIEQTRVAQCRLKGRIRCASFDRGFHSPENQRQLAEIIACPCLPMTGMQQARQQEQTATVQFRRARKRHAGIESAIGALQSGNGLARCRDRSERGFQRYVQLGILGRNLHVLGKVLIAREDAHSKAAESRRGKRAA
ncbi:MAG: ISNCY family transposase [Phycisphaerales bacterium]|nr:MAG: ISNCY family transposase [Phycisphaerales bacterium]